MLRSLIVASVVHAVAGASGDTWMTEAEMRRELVGSTMVGYYTNGERFSDAYATGGGIVYSDEHFRWTGEWSFVGDVFCTLYNDRVDGGCFLLKRISENCYEYYFVADEWRGPGMPEEHNEAWTARGWRDSEPTTCEAPPTV